MNIITTIPDSAIPAWQSRVDQYNAGSGQPPVDIEGFAQIFRDEETARYVVEKADADLMAVSGDADLVAAGLKAMRSSPEKKAAAIAAFDEALASAPSRQN